MAQCMSQDWICKMTKLRTWWKSNSIHKDFNNDLKHFSCIETQYISSNQFMVFFLLWTLIMFTCFVIGISNIINSLWSLGFFSGLIQSSCTFKIGTFFNERQMLMTYCTAAWKDQLKNNLICLNELGFFRQINYLFGRIRYLVGRITISSDELAICLDELRFVWTN